MEEASVFIALFDCRDERMDVFHVADDRLVVVYPDAVFFEDDAYLVTFFHINEQFVEQRMLAFVQCPVLDALDTKGCEGLKYFHVVGQFFRLGKRGWLYLFFFILIVVYYINKISPER